MHTHMHTDTQYSSVLKIRPPHPIVSKPRDRFQNQVADVYV